MTTNSPPTPSKSTTGTARQFVKDYKFGLVSLAVVVALTGLALIYDSSGRLLYQQSELLVFLLLLAALVIASEIGFRVGLHEKTLARDTTRVAHTTEIQTAMFALLGLLLAFTFSMAVSRYESRRAALVEESNAISAAYLRAQLLSEPQRSAEKALIRRYTDLRIASARPNWYTDTTLLRQTSDLQGQIWTQAAAVSQQNPQSQSASLFVESVNNMIEAQGARDAARLNTIPGSVVYVLVASSCLALGILGYRAGLGGDRALLATILLALVVAVVLLLILDLDRPYRGLVTISQQILIQLRNSMGP